jgi:hypothetical protein
MSRLKLSIALAAAGLALTVSARAETVQCIEIAGLPFAISAPGVYCLKDSLTYTDWGGHHAIGISCNDVVIDLNGHVLDGTAQGAASTGVLAFGVRNITIRNGTIRGFRMGVSLDDNPPYSRSRGHVVEDVRAENSGWIGLRVGGQGSVVRGNQVIATGGQGAAYPNPTGIWMNGAGVHVVDNEIVDTIAPAGGEASGITVQTSVGSAVERNFVRNATTGPSIGIYFAGGERATAVANRIVNMKQGILMGLAPASGIYMDNTVGGAAQPFVGGTAAGTTNFSF